ncbi:MAG: hypothetical protein CL676_05980 [Bdellovibrionaceae bacterium]|nr:hypothetical protein [Pseudobdellovibrionaceae bacterium]
MQIVKKPLFVLCTFEKKIRKKRMTLNQLDLLFPFFVFGYGVIMCVVNSIAEWVAKSKPEIPPYFFERLKSHEALGWVCLFVGGLWSLQSLTL